MAQRKAADNLLTWISDEQLVHEQSEHGGNQQSVSDALSEQRRRTQMVADYNQQVDTVCSAVKDPSVKEKVTTAYDELTATANKRLGCLGDIAQIASLEELFNSMSVQFAQRATSLVDHAYAEADDGDDESEAAKAAAGGEGVSRAAQSCVLAVRNNWAWISKLVRCADVHLEHVTDYHQFYHDVKEFGDWMPADLRIAEQKLTCTDSASLKDVNRMLLELKELLTLYLHWQGKINNLFERSKKVIPVHLRTKKIDHYRPISSLCNYSTKQISIQEGEELTLLDNSAPQSWLVRTMHAREASVPSVICIIPGPDPSAINAARRLSLKFLATWTVNVKRIGKNMIQFLLLVFKESDKDLMLRLRSLSDLEREDLVSCMNFINKSLSKYWSEYDDYQTLRTRFQRLKELLAREGGKGDDTAGARQLADQVETIDQLMRRYKDFWSNWETYKMILETSQNAGQILIVDKWQQLNFRDTTEMMRKWHTDLDVTDSRSHGDETQSSQTMDEIVRMTSTMLGLQQTEGGASLEAEGTSLEVTAASQANETAAGMEDSGSFGEGQYMTTTTTTKTTTEEEEKTSKNTGMEGSGSFGEGQYMTTTSMEETAEEMVDTANGYESGTVSSVEQTQTTSTAETQQISTSEQEEKKTFVITGVFDPRSGEEVSMHQAVMLGIINSKEGTYVNPDTGYCVPIPTAMNMGKIRVEFTTTRKTAEKRRDVGLITIKTQRESRPYTVKAVVDAVTEKHLSVAEAIEKGILDQASGTYRNNRDNSEMSLADALDSGLLIVEFDKEAPEVAPEVVTRTYAIHAVVDQRSKQKVTFTEAVRKGLIDKATGAYHHGLTGEDIYVGDAIKRGFIKATVVKDPNSLDIDPENKMVINKIEAIRRKVLSPIRAMAAFKKAAAANSNGK